MGKIIQEQPLQQMQVIEDDEIEINLRDLMRVLVKRRWVIAATVALITLTSLVYCLTTDPIYLGNTRVLIEKDNSKLMSIQEAFAVDTSGTDYYQTQYEIIKSRTVAGQVLERFGPRLEKVFFPPENDESLWTTTRHWFKETTQSILGFFGVLTEGRGGTKVLTEEESRQQKLLNAFQYGVVVTPVKRSRLVDVGFESKDPVLAARVANALAEAYITNSLENRLKATQEAMSWLNRRIVKERQRVEDAERKLQEYRERNRIITEFSGEVETVTAQKLAQLNSQVVEAESKRVEAETRYAQARRLLSQGKVTESLPEVINNPLIQEIKKEEARLYGQLSEYSRRYGANHPKILAAKSELKTQIQRQESEVRRIVDSLKNSYEVARAREESLKSALERQKVESLDLNKKAIEYGVLKRQAEGARDMYEILIKRFKETSVAEDINASNIRVIDPAQVPQQPVKPKKQLILTLSLVLSLMLGIFLAFGFEYFDNTIKVPEEVENYLEIPYLGVIPNIFGRLKKGETRPGELITIEKPKSIPSEAYRNLRTRILFSSAGRPPKTILCTSAAASEGKTLTIGNLAATMAQSGSRVLVVDCDMRRPRLHRVMGVGRGRGLSNVLVGDGALGEVIQATYVPNLHVITAGPVPPNPSELLGSDAMAEVLTALAEKYDRVLLDSPPVTAVTDSMILSKIVDGVLLVVLANQTAREIVKNGIGLLKGVNAHILGGILNAIEMEKNAYYYQYYYYYNSAYAEDGTETRNKKKGRRKKKSAESYPSTVD